MLIPRLTDLFTSMMPTLTIFVIGPMLRSFVVEHSLVTYFRRQVDPEAKPDAGPLAELVAYSKWAVAITALVTGTCLALLNSLSAIVASDDSSLRLLNGVLAVVLTVVLVSLLVWCIPKKVHPGDYNAKSWMGMIPRGSVLWPFGFGVVVGFANLLTFVAN